jgi:hypothetical protein
MFNNRDLRKYAQQTNVRLGVGAFLVLFIIGDGLIYLIYGPGAAITGLLCLTGGIVPILLIIAALWFMEWIVKRANRE